MEHHEPIVASDRAHRHCVQRRLRLTDLPEHQPPIVWCVDCRCRVRAADKRHRHHQVRPIEPPATPKPAERERPREVLPLGRTLSGIAGWDEVLGGGLQDDQVVLLAGEAGVGKTSLLLQAMAAYVSRGRDVAYFSGEQTVETLRNTFTAQNPDLPIDAARAQFFSTTSLDEIDTIVAKERPGVVFLDSVKTFADPRLGSRPGTIAQVNRIADYCKELGHAPRYVDDPPAQCPVILVGHFTSEDEAAGGAYLKHMVDTVLYFRRGENDQQRYLSSGKNRVGAEGELAVFEFRGSRLVEVRDIARRRVEELGDQVGVVGFPAVGQARVRIELVEALVTSPSTDPPVGDLRCEGIASARLRDLLVDLGQWCSVADWNARVVRVKAPASPDATLAVALALLASARNVKLSPRLALAFGTVSLTGKVQPVERMDDRVVQAFKAGARMVIGPAGVTPPAGVTRIERDQHHVAPAPDALVYVVVRTLAELERWVLTVGQFHQQPPPPPRASAPEPAAAVEQPSATLDAR